MTFDNQITTFKSLAERVSTKVMQFSPYTDNRGKSYGQLCRNR